MTVLGHRVRAGEVVIASLSGADRDPAWAGPDPDRFDPLRVPPSGHLAFGHGAHRCIGAGVTRLFETNFEAIINNSILISHRFRRKKRDDTGHFIETRIDIINSTETFARC